MVEKNFENKNEFSNACDPRNKSSQESFLTTKQKEETLQIW